MSICLAETPPFGRVCTQRVVQEMLAAERKRAESVKPNDEDDEYGKK